MAADARILEKLYLRLLRDLAPPDHHCLRGRFRPFYTEKQWERKRRLEKLENLPPESADPDPLDRYHLLRNQLMDLMLALGLTPREAQVAVLRLDGLTAAEIARGLRISERRVGQILQSLRRRLGDTLEDAEGRLRPGAAGHYGWQEVLLQTVRRRTPVRRCFR